MPRPCRNFHIHSRLRPLIRQRAKIMQCKRELARRMWLCTNRFGCAVKSGRADDRRCRDSGYEKRVPLVGDGRLGAQRHLVNRAGDPMPVITGDPEHAQIAHGYEDRGQSQAQDRVNGTVESGSQAPRVVAEVRRAATEARAVSAAATIIRQSHEGFRPFRSRFASISRLVYRDGEDWRSLEGFRIGKTRDQCMNFVFEIPCISNFVFFLSLSFFSFLEIIARTRSLGRF